MSPSLCLLRGDGIGDELIGAVERVLAELAPDVERRVERVGLGAFREHGRALPEAALRAARSSTASVLVAVGSPSEPTPGYRSPVVELRRRLDLFANLRPVRSLSGSGRRPVDLLIVRENTEGLYGGRSVREGDRATCERVVTAAASRRIARVAAGAALARDRRVCVVHKANVLRETCGLFREAVLDELSRAGDLEVDELLVDHAAYRLAAVPHEFDVIVTTNLFGDVLSDVAAAAGGGLGLVSSSNLGDGTALFEPVHGSAPDLVGTGRANPIASLRATRDALAFVARHEVARRLGAAIDTVLSVGPFTPDLSGDATTGAVVDAVLDHATRTTVRS